MCVVVHAWRLIAFSWSFVVVLCTSPVGDNERPWPRVRLLVGAGVRAATAVRIARLGKKFYQPVPRLIKYRRLRRSPAVPFEKNYHLTNPPGLMLHIVYLFFFHVFQGVVPKLFRRLGPCWPLHRRRGSKPLTLVVVRREALFCRHLFGLRFGPGLRLSLWGR